MIIGFAGKIGSGKDTAGEYLAKEYGFKRIAFADNLKYMAMTVFDLTYNQCHDREEKEADLDSPITVNEKHIIELIYYVEKINKWKITTNQIDNLYETYDPQLFLNTPREVLQYLGTELVRTCIDADYHAKVVKNIIDSYKWDNVVVTDCRFPNERDAIKRWGGFNVLIERNTNDSNGLANHASESSLGEPKDYNGFIVNDASLNELYERVDSCYHGFKRIEKLNIPKLGM